MNKKIGWICALIIFVCALIFINEYLNNRNLQQAGEQISQAQLQEVESGSNENSKQVTKSINDENTMGDNTTEDTASSHTQSLANDGVIQVTSDNFAEVVLNSGKTVVVDFYADWCPPCKALAPIIDEVAVENQDENLVFVRLNTDDEGAISNEYGIRSIPTLVLIKNGKEVDRSIGYIEKEEVLAFVNQ